MSYSIEKLVFYLRGLFSAPIICELSKRKVFTYKKNKAHFNLNSLNKIKGKKELTACLNYLDRIDLINKVGKNNFELVKSVDLAELCITSSAIINLSDKEEIKVKTIKSKGKKCPVCWKISLDPCPKHS